MYFNLTDCKGNTIIPTTQFVEANFFSKVGECIDAWLIIKHIIIRQKKRECVENSAENSPTLPIYNKVGRERERGKRGKSLVFTN